MLWNHIEVQLNNVWVLLIATCSLFILHNNKDKGSEVATVTCQPMQKVNYTNVNQISTNLDKSIRAKLLFMKEQRSAEH